MQLQWQLLHPVTFSFKDRSINGTHNCAGSDSARESTPCAIETLCSSIVSKLRTNDSTTIEGVPPAHHYLAPFIPKSEWSALGDAVSANEKRAQGSVDGSQWISLRLDGSNFSKTVQRLRRLGILGAGFSDRFAVCMQTCVEGLMKKFAASIGYTQSDEMVVFIPPTSIVRGEREPHMRNGRVTKLTTLAAGYVTAKFMAQLAQLCVQDGVGLDGLAETLPHFDCRLGHFDSWEECQALLLWRAYDCSVNGVSDAVHQIKGAGKAVVALNTRQKLVWLSENGHLPLPLHQAYGTVFCRVRRVVRGHNPVKDEETWSLRGVIERVDGPVLDLVKRDALWLRDDKAPEAGA